MKPSRCLFLALLMVVCSTAFSQQQRYDRVLIHLDTSHTIRQLQRLGIEVDHGVYRRGISFTSDFSAAEAQAVRSAGFACEVLIPDIATYYAQQAAEPQASSQRAVTCSSPASYSVQTPAHFRTGSMGGFLTYPEMLDQLDSMHALYPSLISARIPADTFHSIEGRPIYWMRISDHPDSTQAGKPQILYTALHHAREPAGLTDVIFYMWYLLEHYQTSAEVRALVDHTEMYIMPCVNPDGYIYNYTTNPNGGGMWRKNRRLNADGTYGVDLNRNYGYFWGYDNDGSSPTTTDETYRGTAGFSEPEISAVKWLAEQHQFRIAINYHTYSNMLIYPWGYEAGLLTPDSSLFVAYAKTMTKYNGFLYGTGDQTVGYVTNGDSDDWMYGEQSTKNKILSMTPESGSAAYGFWPPASEVANVAKENFDLIYYAHKFLLRHLEVTDLTPKVALSRQFWFRYEAQRLGLDSGATYSIHIASSDPNVIAPAAVHTITDPALLATITDSFSIQLDPSIAPGTSFSFQVVVNNGLYTYTDTITKKYIQGDTLYYNDCNFAAAFTSTTWGLTTASYTSPTGAITDSRTGDYRNNANTTILLNDTIDLTHATAATLLFQAHWQIEKDYDYVLCEASDNGTTWTPLCGLNSSSGTNQANAFQSRYDGYQDDWVQEVIDLGDYTGRKVKLRFHLVSDQFETYDGFYFDDLTVLATSPDTLVSSVRTITSASGDWQLYPNPATDRVVIRPAALEGEMLTIYDAIGAEVSRIRIQHSQIDLTGIAPGAYSLMTTKGDYTQTVRKLIIIR